MESKLPKGYEPSEVEKKWYEAWEKSGCFHADENSPKPRYSIVIPPPNVTGVLHMGHALNNTLQDILARWKRMTGHEVLWMPGTDHAGIATQNVVEKQLANEGKDRHELGRERFVERVWQWRRESGGRIINIRDISVPRALVIGLIKLLHPAHSVTPISSASCPLDFTF